MLFFSKIILIIFSLSGVASAQVKWEGLEINNFIEKKLKLKSSQFEKYIITSLHEKNELIEIWSKKQARNIFLEIHKQSLNIKEFENFKKSNLIIVRNLYREIPSPYPGALSKGQDCANGNSRPLEYEVVSKRLVYFVFEGAASERFVFGVCDPKEVKYQGAIVLFKTENNYSLMRVFIPIKDFLKDRETIRNLVRSITLIE